MVAAPIAGVFVDRWDRRRIMPASDLARSVLFAALAVIAAVPGTRRAHGSLAVIYAIAVGAGVAGRFFYPARTAYTADVVTEPTDRSRASGISQATAAIATIAGPPLAAPGFRAELWAGVSFITRNRVLVVLLVTIVVTTLGIGAVNARLRARVGGLSFGPVDTVFPAGGLLVVGAGLYTAAALDDAPSALPQPEPDAGVGGQ